MGKFTLGITSSSGTLPLVTALILSVVAAAPASAAPKKKKAAVVDCEKVVAGVSKGWPVDQTEAVSRIRNLMRDHKECACEIATEAFYAAPRLHGQADSRLLAALLNGVLLSNYNDLGNAKCDARELVFSAIRALGDGRQFAGDGKNFVPADGKNVIGSADPRAVAQLMAAALPVIFAYEPALVDGLVQSVIAEFPAAGALLTQMRADLLLSPLALTRNRLRVEGTVVEPNFRDFTDGDLKQLQALLSSLELAEQAAASP